MGMLEAADRFPRRDLSHDARQIVLMTGLISASYFGAYALLRGLFILRLGYSYAYLGTYYAAGALVFMVMGIPSGTLGHRLGTRTSMLVGGFLTAGGMFLLPITAYLPSPARDLWPPLTQVIAVAGWSMLSVNSVPALMLVTTEGNRGATYARTGVLRGIGTFAGTLVGGVLPDACLWVASGLGWSPSVTNGASPFAWALLVSAAMGFASLIPLFRIRGGLRPTRSSEGHQTKGAFPTLLVAAMFAYVFLRHVGWTSCQAYCSPYLDSDLRLATPIIGVLTSIGQIAAIGAALILPRIAQRFGHGCILIASTVIQLASLALLLGVRHWSAAGLGLLGIQVSSAVWLPELQVFQMERVAEAWRGTAYGSLAMAMGLGFGTMSYAGGLLIATRGYGFLFTGGAIATLGAIGLVTGISRVPVRLSEASRPVEVQAACGPDQEESPGNRDEARR